MHHAIETAPRDGKFVILEDDASRTYDVAHWSPEAGEWVGKNGEPSKITPTHWFPLARDKYLLQEGEGSSNPSQVRPSAWRRGYNFSVDVVAAAALISLFFYVIRDPRQPDIVRISTIGGQVVAQETRLPTKDSGKTALPASRQTEANQARAPEEAQQAQQVAVAAVPEAQALAQELTEARRAIEGLDVQLRAEAAKSAQSLEQEREKTAALAQEAAAARQELTTSTAKYHQALDEESARSAALASELATAQREIETQAAQLRKASEETGQLKQAEAAKSAQSLEQEREKTAALAQEAAAARQELTANSQTAPVTQAVKAAAPKQPAAAVSQGGPEVARLMVRARALLGQGNIGAARLVLERAAETGSAQASFMLAETYDPVILSAWGTYGTRGEATKAREFYAKAHAGGIQEANDRFNALR